MKFLIYKRTERANRASEHRILFPSVEGGKNPTLRQHPTNSSVWRCGEAAVLPALQEALPPLDSHPKNLLKNTLKVLKVKTKHNFQGFPYLYPFSSVSVALTFAVTLNVLLDSPTTEGKILFLKSAQLHSSSSFKVGR